MENKIYKFKDTEFTVQKNVLKIQNAWMPIAIYFENLVKLCTAECDMSAVNSYKARLKELEIKEKQDNSDILKPDIDSDVKSKIELQIESNKAVRDTINSEFENDTVAQEQQAEYNRMFNYAIQLLITSYDMIDGFLRKYLIGDYSKLDYEDENIVIFIGEVIGDFFLYKMQNRN